MGVNWEQISVGVAAVLALIYAVSSMRWIVSRFAGLITNHLTHQEEAMREMTVAMERLADRIELLLAQERRNGGRS